MFLHLYSYIKNFLPGHYKTFQILIKWFLEYELLGLKTKINEKCISTVQFDSIQKLIQKSHNSWKKEREEKATNYLNFIVKNIVAKTFISFSLNVERSFYNSNNYGNISVGLLVLQGSSGLHRAGGDRSDKIRDPIHFWRETDHRTREPLVQADAVRLNARASSRMGSIQYKISYEKIKSSFSRCENT